MIKNLIAWARKRNASDLHLTCGYKPMERVNGRLEYIDDKSSFSKPTDCIAESMASYGADNNAYSYKALKEFLTEELFPYVELNYPVIDMPESRTIIVQDYNAIKVLENLPSISNSAKNMIFAFNYTTAMPEISNNLDKGLNILALGPLENLAPLSNIFQNNGLVYLDNFACAFLKNYQKILMEANLNYIFNKKNRKIVDDSVYQPKDEFYAGIEYSFPFWFNLKTKDGYNLVYIPQILDIEPPFMAWKPTESKLSIIYGSPATKIRIKGEYPFGGSFRTNFRLVDLPVDK